MRELEDLIGSRLVFGIPGTSITPEVVRHFQETRAGGLILYRINFESPGQLVKLIRDLEEALGRRLLVVADHEGGRVVMFREGVTVFPDNLTMGRLGEADSVRRQGGMGPRSARRLGIDINFAPVLDVLTKAYSPNIGIRSYGEDPELVAPLGAARIRTMQAGGLSATAKHFPGKGHSPLDAHLRLPVIPSTWEEMEKTHLIPFVAAIEAGVDVIMSSHPLYPNLDPTPQTPATFSRRIIGEHLRGHLGYQGVISSDDLEMGAIRELCPIGQAAVKAAGAGHDLLLSCHDPVSQRQVFEALCEAYRSKALSTKDLEASVQRIEVLKSKRPERFAPGPLLPVPEGFEFARDISNKAVAVLKDPQHILPLSAAKNGRILVIFPALSSLASKIMIEKDLEQEAQFLAQRFGRWGEDLKNQSDVVVLPIEPPDSEIEKAAALVFNADLVVLFCFDAHLYPSNRNLLSQVQGHARKLVVVLMRDPYDVEFIGGREACVTAFGFRVCQLEAAIEKIFSR